MTSNGSDYVIDVTEQSFATEVLEKSKTVPVVVDFWAAWCGPCRMLGPTLEQLAKEADGAFILAKVDVDSNQSLARQYQVQGIPAVKAFRNGNVINEFVGAKPEPQVRSFINSLQPSQADIMAQQAQAAEAEANWPTAESLYQQVLAKQADYYPAMIGLGRVLLQQNKLAEGIAQLEAVPEGTPHRAEADALIVQAQFQQHAEQHTEAELRAKITADAHDVQSRYQLACLLATEERYQEAMDMFLDVIRLERHYQDDAPRKAMLALFTMLGDDEESVQKYRRKLANAFF